jgi:lipopolysaccharide export system protein LptA
MSTHRASRFIPALLLLALAQTAGAASNDRQQEMLIGADYTNAALDGDGEAVLRGNVLIEQGSLRVEADEATVTRRGGEISLVELDGTPARLQQRNDDGALMRARARRIEYQLDSEVIVMTGGVEVDQPQGTMRGERITYDLASGRLNAGGEGGRIFMRIAPGAGSGATGDER